MQDQIKLASYRQSSESEEKLLLMAAFQMAYKVTAVGMSDIGLVRQNNEDVWAGLPEIGFYVLADGMGGHQAGEVAAKETVNILSRVLKKKLPQSKYDPLPDTMDLLRRSIIHANGLVYKMGRADQDLRGMGTTLCCLLFHREGLVFAHVGDSRIYRLRGKVLEQLTKDHSLLCELLDQGQLNEQQATDFLYKNIITKAVGTEPKVDPNVEFVVVLPGDIFLMCSDGLSDLLNSDEIASVLGEATTLKQAAKTLINVANEKGGRDNITVVIAKIEGKNVAKDLSR